MVEVIHSNQLKADLKQVRVVEEREPLHIHSQVAAVVVDGVKYYIDR